MMNALATAAAEDDFRFEATPVLIEIAVLIKRFATQAREPVLADINLRIVASEFLSVVGPSGRGEATLARTLTLLENATGTGRIGNKAVQCPRDDVATACTALQINDFDRDAIRWQAAAFNIETTT